MAASGTVIITLVITIYAMKTKTDFTTCGCTLFIALFCLIILTIFAAVLNVPFLHTIVCVCCLFLYGIYLAYDT